MHSYVLEEDSERLDTEQLSPVEKQHFCIYRMKGPLAAKEFMLSPHFQIVALSSYIVSDECSCRR